MSETIVYGGLFFILGTIIGSFLNVCIVRLPHEKSVVFPGSHCVQCKAPIRWFDNIPLVSYVLLGGKCRHCGAKFSFRYVFIEFLTGLSFLGFYLYYGLDIRLVAYLTMMAGFIVATFVDFEHRIIPDEVSIGGVFIGLMLSVFISFHDVNLETLMVGRKIMYIFLVICAISHGYEYFIKKQNIEKVDIGFFGFIGLMVLIDLVSQVLTGGESSGWKKSLLSLDAAVIGVLVGGGCIYLMGLLGDFLFKKESMGGGDVKLLAMIGAFLGWKMAILTFFIAPFFGAVLGIIEKIRTNDTAIPYGPFLVLGALISLFYGDQIIYWIISGYGLYPRV
jgi:leader peptidase (prepilin peptidase)/N-methyltransferase